MSGSGSVHALPGGALMPKNHVKRSTEPSAALAGRPHVPGARADASALRSSVSRARATSIARRAAQSRGRARGGKGRAPQQPPGSAPRTVEICVQAESAAPRGRRGAGGAAGRRRPRRASTGSSASEPAWTRETKIEYAARVRWACSTIAIAVSRTAANTLLHGAMARRRSRSAGTRPHPAGGAPHVSGAALLYTEAPRRAPVQAPAQPRALPGRSVSNPVKTVLEKVCPRRHLRVSSRRLMRPRAAAARRSTKN
jgi:hypothetical protein